MSYDIYLKDPVTNEVCTLSEPHHMRGGTYALGGTTECHLNITYNYSNILQNVLGKDGVRSIYGKTGADSISLLEEAISKLKDDVDEDYWKPTEGNTKRSLLQLVALGKMRPDGIWNGD